ncbi:MAG: hypothetical protein HC869_16195 [Rhodospirillales bacterium]|nr:hypothetical protein [Rhodospirillales bacterium]
MAQRAISRHGSGAERMLRKVRSGGSLLWLLAAACTGLFGSTALAGSGQPSPRQIYFQEAVTPIAEQIQNVPRHRQLDHLRD